MTRHGRCTAWTESLGRVVQCGKDVEHDGSHWGSNHRGNDVVWAEVTLTPPAATES